MVTHRVLVLLCFAGFSSVACFAATGVEKSTIAAAVRDTSGASAVPVVGAGTGTEMWSSSLATVREAAPAPAPRDGREDAAPVAGMDSFAQAISGSAGTRPFSALGVAVKVGAEGVGFDVATPLAQKFNLRVGASFFEYTHSQVVDGITINPDLKFRKAGASVDYYPFGGSFRISPGFVFYNGNHATATANVPGGGTFTLDDVTYTSSTVDPVRGSAEIAFGNKAAPSITVGFGNMIPRKGGHWSVPFEVGFEYIGKPTFVYNLAGTACNQFGCMNVATSPDIQANLKAEQDELNSDISALRFYPILSVGIGYRF